MSIVAANMECPLVKELSNCLKENSHSGIVSCLTRIKTDEKCSQTVLENGGVFLLIELLRYRNTRVMDATLSILANACLLSHVRKKVEGTKIASYVVWIAKNLQSGETMHCRACRLMGNLSESNNHARALCDAGAVEALTEILKSKSNAQTLGMAVRAVRNIWIRREGRYEIMEAGTIAEITRLLVRSRKKILERENDTKYADLAESCLKAMYVFADSTDPRSCAQMRGDKSVHGYRCIVDYCRASNKTAIKCLYKLCLHSERRPDLGNSGAIECLLEVLGSCEDSTWNYDRTNSSSSFWKSLVSLCLFCREAVNRAKIRRGAGLEAILSLLTEVKNERFHPMLLHALSQFICDDLSMEIMIKNGLLDILVEKLKKMAVQKRKSEKKELDGKNGKKRSADSLPYSRSPDFKFYRPNHQYGRFSVDYPIEDWSPSRTSTSYSSPPSTPPLLSGETGSDVDEYADDNYSPICSDTEWIENDDLSDVQNDGELSSRSRIGGNRDEENDDEEDFMKADENFDDNYQEDNEEEHEASSTLALLNMLSHSSVPIEKLSDATTIQALVGYIASAKNNRASSILARIIRNCAYFVPLLLQGFVFEAQSLYGADRYTRALCDAADTGGAFGDMATLLLRGEESQKLIVAVSIPYIIKNREKLRTLLCNHGGLDLIFNVVQDAKNTLYEDAILAISKLAMSIDISSPQTCVNNETEEQEIDNDLKDFITDEETDLDNDVIFELDDGSTLRARRNTICEKSTFFSAMLEGSFLESGQNHVRLKEATKDGLSTLLLATKGDFSSYKENIEAILDAVILADKFLMAEISERLTQISIKRINHENICRAWKWSRLHSCLEFRDCCVKIFLASSMLASHRLKAFRDFHETTSFCEFIDDVRDIISQSLVWPPI